MLTPLELHNLTVRPMQKLFTSWLMSEEATKLLEQMKRDWEEENREDEESEVYALVHIYHPADDEEDEFYDYE